MTLRAAMAVLLALALLEGALGRPHGPEGLHGQEPERNELPPIRHHKQHHRHGHHHAALERRQFCGANLSEALRLLCAGRGYYSPDSNSGSSTSHHGSGVVTECCRQGCSQQDLEQYCQPRKNAPPPAGDLSAETTEEQPADSTSLDSAHQANHIRHSVETTENSEPAKTPTVVGGKGSFDMSALKYNMSEMIKVGTITQPHLIPVRISVRHRTNSLK